MAVLRTLADMFGLDTFAADFRSRIMAYGVIGLLMLISFVFFLMALTTGLADTIGPVLGPLVVGIVALLIALIALVTIQNTSAMEKRRTSRLQTNATTALMTSAALTLVPTLLSNPVIRRFGLPAAVLAGLLYLSLRKEEAK